MARDAGISAKTHGGEGENLLRRCDERKQAQRRSKGRVHIFTRRATPADGLEKTTGAASAPRHRPRSFLVVRSRAEKPGSDSCQSKRHGGQ